MFRFAAWPHYRRAAFSKLFFGHGTLFNLVNFYETRVFCGPSFIKQMLAQRDLLVTKWKIFVKIFI